MTSTEHPTGAEDAVEIALEAAQADGGGAVGRVVRTGERGGALLDRRVLVPACDPCGECDVCRRGGAAVCPRATRRALSGGLVTAAARWLVPLDDGLALASPEAAAVAGDVTTAYTLYARTGIAPREPVVVIGANPIGRFLIEILIAKGSTPAALAAGEPWAEWLRTRGVAAGADHAELSAALAERDLGTRPWRMICADPGSIAIAAALAGPRATLTALAGAGATPLPGELVAREVLVIGVAGPHPDLIVEAAALCVRGDIDLRAGTSRAPDPLRTHVCTPGSPG